MHSTPPLAGRRRRAFLRASLVVLLGGSLTLLSDPRPALAFSVPPLPVGLPAGLAGAGATGGAIGEVAAVGAGGAEVAAGGAAIVAAAPVAVVAGAVLATGGAVWLGWKWASGHDSHAQDPTPPAPPAPGAMWTPGMVGWSNLIGTTYTQCTDSATVAPYDWKLCNTGYPTGTDPFYAPAIKGWSDIVPSDGLVAGASSGAMTGHWHGQMAIVSKKTSDGTIKRDFSTTTQGCYQTGYTTTTAYPPVAFSVTLTCTSGYTLLGVDRVQATGTAEQRMGFGVAAPVSDGTITTTAKSQCSDGSTVVGNTVTYTGTTDAASLPPLNFPACPAGTTRTGITTPTTNAGTVVPSPITWTKPTIPSGFPECNTTHATCLLVLTHLGQGTGAQELACSDMQCAGWQKTAVQSGTTTRTVLKADGTSTTEIPYKLPNGDTLSCRWGPYLMKTSECTTYPTEPKPAGSTGSDSCMSGMWSWNPVDWVYTPVKCAMVWAFEPDPVAMEADAATLRTSWDASAPGSLITAITGLIAPATTLAGSGSCDGPTFDFDFWGAFDYSLSPFTACPPALAWFSGVVLAVQRVLILAGAAYASARLVLAAVGQQMPGEG